MLLRVLWKIISNLLKAAVLATAGGVILGIFRMFFDSPPDEVAIEHDCIAGVVLSVIWTLLALVVSSVPTYYSSDIKTDSDVFTKRTRKKRPVRTRTLVALSFVLPVCAVALALYLQANIDVFRVHIDDHFFDTIFSGGEVFVYLVVLVSVIFGDFFITLSRTLHWNCKGCGYSHTRVKDDETFGIPTREKQSKTKTVWEEHKVHYRAGRASATEENLGTYSVSREQRYTRDAVTTPSTVYTHCVCCGRKESFDQSETTHSEWKAG